MSEDFITRTEIEYLKETVEMLEKKNLRLYKRCKSLNRKANLAHKYKVEMERLRRKLTRIYAMAYTMAAYRIDADIDDASGKEAVDFWKRV